MEKVIETIECQTGTWDWLYSYEQRQLLYYHRGCDCFADQNGHCILCGATVPGHIEEGLH
jgi:hypothetical protein